MKIIVEKSLETEVRDLIPVFIMILPTYPLLVIRYTADENKMLLQSRTCNSHYFTESPFQKINFALQQRLILILKSAKDREKATVDKAISFYFLCASVVKLFKNLQKHPLFSNF